MNQRALNPQRFDTNITEDVNIKAILEYVQHSLLAIGLENTALAEPGVVHCPLQDLV